jgi:hypothetical protein
MLYSLLNVFDTSRGESLRGADVTAGRKQNGNDKVRRAGAEGARRARR